MNQFECIEKHLYLRQYQTAGGELSTIYYAGFTDWQGIRRKFPLGDDLSDARDKLGEVRNLNKGRYDWDAEKKKAEEKKRRAVTFSQWGNRYFDDGLNPNPDMRASSIDRENRSFALLDKFFGDLALVEITKSKILDYRKKRRPRVSALLLSIVSFGFWESSFECRCRSGITRLLRTSRGSNSQARRVGPGPGLWIRKNTRRFSRK